MKASVRELISLQGGTEYLDQQILDEVFLTNINPFAANMFFSFLNPSGQNFSGFQ